MPLIDADSLRTATRQAHRALEPFLSPRAFFHGCGAHLEHWKCTPERPEALLPQGIAPAPVVRACGGHLAGITHANCTTPSRWLPAPRVQDWTPHLATCPKWDIC